VAASTTLNPAPGTCTSRRIGVVRHVHDNREGQAGGGGRRGLGPRPGRMDIHSVRGISDNGALIGDTG
jgi:hypothetical protein